MAWLSPAAFVGLAAVAGPILVHLLRRRQARRIVVPSVRFVVEAAESSVHFRRISDPVLLTVRITVIVAAVVSLARPLLITEARTAKWAERVSRAVLLDTSESARGAITDEAIAAESNGADPVRRVNARDVGSGLRRAAAWLAHAPPSRREIVVLSDFQRGALTASDLAAVPSEIGIRLIRGVPSSASDDRVRWRVLSPQAALSGEADLASESTTASYRFVSPSWTGLEVVTAPAHANEVTALRRVLSRAGVQAPVAERPISVRFAGAPDRSAGEPVDSDWTFGAGQRLLEATRRLDVALNVSSVDGTLLVDVGSGPSSLAAAQVAAAALNARIDPATFTERETALIPPETLVAWSREPAAPDTGDWTRTDSSDGRYFWVLVLLLLGLESLLRGRQPAIVDREERHAA